MSKVDKVLQDEAVIKILTRSRSTGGAIIWATDEYEEFGRHFGDEIKVSDLIQSKDGFKVLERSQKAKARQATRTRQKAEVATPAWICNEQLNAVDDEWFGRSGVFNKSSNFATFGESDAFDALDAPNVTGTCDNLNASNTSSPFNPSNPSNLSNSPDASSSFNTPDASNNTSTCDAPNAPSTPNITSTSSTPSTSNTSSTLSTPNVTGTCSTPNVSDTLNAPNNTSAPNTPSTPSTPDIPNITSTPNTPNTPSTCNPPNPPNPPLLKSEKVFFDAGAKVGGLRWRATDEKIRFPLGKTFMDYIERKVLEVASGEAPYLTTRYDAATGAFIAVSDRVGVMDRKLRVVSENARDSDDWLQLAERAFKATYGYEWQGDSLFLGRRNLVLTFIEHYCARFGVGKEVFGAGVLRSWLLKIATIISYNLFQMDGLKGVVPGSCHKEKAVSEEEGQLLMFDDESEGQMLLFEEECPGCKKGDIKAHNGVYAKVMDWEKGKMERFVEGVL